MIVGIIGGGQLAQMLILNNPQHVYYVLDPNVDCSCHNIANLITTSFDDVVGFEMMNEICDVITFEFENVNINCLKLIEDKLFPKVDILQVSKNRLFEKRLAQNLDINVNNFIYCNHLSSIVNFSQKFGFPLMLKTLTGGYDGKNQVKIKNIASLFSKEVLNLVNNYDCIVEEFINFDFETSAIISKNFKGDISMICPQINIHQNQILRFTKSLNADVISKLLYSQSQKIINEFDIVGTICIEYYVKDGVLFFNEIAPRVHNSGHHSTLGCNVNQFTNTINAITNIALQPCRQIKPTVMVNLLGNELEILKENILALNLVCEHEIVDYQKPKFIAKRKRGHINLSHKNQNILNNDVKKICQLLGVNYEDFICV